MRAIHWSVFLLSFLIGACAEPLTYSKDARTKAMQLYNQNDYANAAGAFGECVRINPRDFQSLYYQATCYAQMNQYQQAIATYKTAREVAATTREGKADPAFREKILDALADTIGKSDQRDAETNATETAAQQNQSAELWLLLAKIHVSRGDADSAIDAFNRAALIDPNNFYCVRDYGLYLAQLGQDQRAEPPLRRAYSLNTQDPQVNAALRKIGVVPGPSIVNENSVAPRSASGSTTPPPIAPAPQD